MVSPRELELGVLSPLAPNFPRKVATGSPTLEKFSGVEDLYDDINRQPTAPSGSTTVKLSMDVPVALRRARFVLENASATIVEAGNVDCGSIKVCDLPDRNIAVFNAEFNGSFLFGGDVAANDDGDWGLGTTAVDARPLADEDVSLIPATAIDNIAASKLVSANASGPSAATGALSPELIADGASNAIYLNFTIDDTQLAADGSVTVNGTVDIWYADLGNVGS